MDKFFDQAPKIIAAAAKSPLGIVALVILALSVLAFVFFADAPEWVRIGIFIVLVLDFGLFGFAAMRRMPETQKPVRRPVQPDEQAAATVTVLSKPPRGHVAR